MDGDQRKVKGERSSDHKDHADKLEASQIFREYWQACQSHNEYKGKKAAFLQEQRAWKKYHRT